MTRVQWDRLAFLERRAAYLGQRINAASFRLTYDEQERVALRWAIDVIKAALGGGDRKEEGGDDKQQQLNLQPSRESR